MCYIYRSFVQSVKKSLSTLNFTLLLLFSLLLTVGCNFFKSQDKKQIEKERITNSIFVLSGNDVIDSLLIAISTSPLDTNLALLYHDVAELYEDYDFSSAKKYYKMMESICDLLKWNQGYYMYAIGYSHVLTRQGLLDSALIINSHALEVANNENNEFWTGKLHYSLGNVFLTKQWFETALNHYMDALEYFERVDNKERLSTVYNQLCLLFTNIDAVEKSITYGKKAVEINPNDPYYLYGLARALTISQQYSKANDYLNKSLEFANQENNFYLVGLIYYSLSENAMMDFDLNTAEKSARKSLQVNKEIDNMSAYAGALSILGKVEELRGNFEEADKYVKEALRLAMEFDITNGKEFCYTLLMELSVAQGKSKEHIQYLKELDLVKNVTARLAVLRAAEEMEAKYDSEKKKVEIERQHNIIKSQQMQQRLFIGCIVLCVLVVLSLWYMITLRDRKNKALEELNVAKDNFFSIISHDLKNPALAQRNALQMLLDNMGQWDEQTLKKYYTSLLKSAEGQVDLLFNLLNWAQMQAGRMPFLPVSFDLVSELKKTDIALLQNMAKQKGVTLNVRMPKTALVKGDSNMIATTIRNLLSNSIKFTQPLERVTLSILKKDNGKHIVAVSDTGIGMSEEQIQKLFDYNHQISKRGTAGEQGMGLGLIVCKDLLDKHHVRLHVKSKINKGSCFWFEI
jgi:signal transduction histidine kinase